MSTDRFDSISKLFASRRTRRGAVTGGVGLAATALSSHALAQTATPEVATSTDPHAGADRDDPSFLFTQAFEAGSWEPKDGEEDVYTLTLTGASAQTVYFSDRPERVFGVAPMQQFLDGLGFSPENPPNAALVAPNADSGEEEILIIELFDPQYDASTATLTYDAKVLADYHEDGLSHAATRQQGYQFPQSFDQGGLFIDDCLDGRATCYQTIDGERRDIGEIHNMGLCWKSVPVPGCVPCDDDFGSSYYGKLCAEAFPDHCFAKYNQDDLSFSWDCHVHR